MSFPSLPANNSTAIVNGIQYVYNSDNNTWKIVPVLVSGAQGATGSQGDTGAQGYQGDTGSQGSQGYQGVQGVIGDTGSQGFQGLRGADGAQGATGSQGDTGAQGYQGDTGSQGSQGYQGEIGSQGYQGDTGSQGSQGYQGEIGSQGYQGDTGVQGEQGTQGYQGVVGAQGATGAQGDTGVQGYQGVQGATGSQGSQGNQGYQGVQGATGSQGSQGNQGYQGVQGATGSQGNQGHQGVQGATGAQGPSATLTPSSYVVRAVKGGSTQTIPNGSDTVVTFTDDYDPQNWWTSNKFQPTIAGYYSISVQIWWEQGSITNNQTNLQLRKNGSAQVAIAQNQITSSVGYFESINTTLYFNGSTDYVEVTAYTSNPTSQNISSSNAGSWFNAELIAYGQTGAQGNQGNQGVAGTQGSAGSQGNQGYQGVQGATGSQGNQGYQGVQGATGAQGVQGATGSQGNQGYQGVQGATGAQGVQGDTGSQGNQGYQGVQGATGAQGVQGATGSQGNQGYQGDTGTGLAAGGTAGELLQKNSSTNYDASWTDTLTGDLTYTGNVSFTGPVNISGTIEQVSGNNGVFFGYAANGFSALYAGYPTYTPLPVTVFQTSGNLDGYIQNNFENVNSGSNATADIVITSDNGTDISGYFDMGITSSNWSGQQENSLGDALEPNDAYLYVQNETGTSGGHLVIGTLQQGKKTKIAAGIGASNVVAEFSSSNLTLHNSLVLTSGTIGTPYYTLPATDGANNQVIVTDGAGNLAWANVTTTTATYTANSITLTNGVYISGNVESIQTFGDTGSGGYFNFTDGTNTGPAWIVNTDFINVVDFNRIVLNISYTQNSGHTVYVQLYNYNTSIWDSFGSYNGLAGYYQFALEALSSVPYVSGGNVQLRLYHNNTGNALHETFIDYIALEKSSQGPMGPKGSQGYQGVQGAIGAQGSTGAQGSQGYQGNQGYQGDTGTQGYQGFQGEVGAQGSQGFQGEVGAQGYQGFQGDNGSQGFQGEVGAQGSTGTQGYQGDIGTQGSQGVSVEIYFANTAPMSPLAGDQWVHSDTGVKYEYIDDGTSSQWVSIPTNLNLVYAVGVQGSPGAQGASGSQGVQGASGAQGSTGAQGPQGASIYYTDAYNQANAAFDTANTALSGAVSLSPFLLMGA